MFHVQCAGTQNPSQINLAVYQKSYLKLQQQLGFVISVMQNDFLRPSPNSFCLQPVITPLRFSELLLFVFNSYLLLWLLCQQAFNRGPEIANIHLSLETWHPCHLLLLRRQSTLSVLTFGQVFKSLFPWIFLFSSTLVLSSYCWLVLCCKPILFIYLFSPGEASSNVNESPGVPLTLVLAGCSRWCFVVKSL